MKKIIFTIPVILFLVGGYAMFTQEKEQLISLYPRSESTFVGDPMPYYNGKEFMIYYLEDLRDEQIGFHPFGLIRTTDFYHYENDGEVLSFVNEEESIERALGTGSVIQDSTGLYHVFYTGHNGNLNPKERIMHGISKDGKTWKKIPEDTFEASNAYEANDFRDPDVFWEEESQSYWMLITTRANGTGVIAKYTSKDLTTWSDEGVFFKNDLGNDSNLECPSLVYFNGLWYLSFSDQWDQRVVHYRVSEKISGPFKAPEAAIDYVDGSGFYAGKLETDGKNLYLVGWIPTKENHDDRFNYNWAGNLAVHQLIVEKEQLIPSLPTEAMQKVTKKELVIDKDSAAKQTFENEGSIVYEGMVDTSATERLILSFGNENHIILDFKEAKMSYWNTFLDKVETSTPKTSIPFVLEEQMNLQIVKEENIVVIYLGNQALSNRIYKAGEGNWIFDVQNK